MKLRLLMEVSATSDLHSLFSVVFFLLKAMNVAPYL